MRGKPKVNYRMVDHFVEHMSSKFEISLVDELTYFLGLPVKQTSNGTFISQTKYVKNLFGLEFVIHHRTPVGLIQKSLKTKVTRTSIKHYIEA